MPRPSRRFVFAIAAFGIGAILAGTIFNAVIMPASPPLPNPNGFDDFMEAANLTEIHVDDGAPNDDEILRLIRLGLSRNCAFDPKYERDAGALSRLIDAANILEKQTTRAEAATSYEEAADLYADEIRFGHEIARAAPLLFCMEGLNCAAVGMKRMRVLCPELPKQKLADLIAKMEQVDRGRVTWKEALSNERRTFLHKNGTIMAALQVFDSRRDKVLYQNRINSGATDLRILIADLAVRRYQFDQGHPPASLNQLVPKYLTRVPLDPFSGKPLAYHAAGTNWIIMDGGVRR